MSTIGSLEARTRPLSRLRNAVRRDLKLVRLFVLTDCLVLAFAVAAALLLGNSAASPSQAALWGGLTLALSLGVLSFYKVYERDRRQVAVSSLDEAADFLNALSVVSFVELSLGQALALSGIKQVGPVTVLLFWLFAVLLLPGARTFVRHVIVPGLDRPENAVVVGAGVVGQTIARKIRKHTEYNVRVVGFLDDEPHPLDPPLDDLPVLGAEHDLVETIRRHRVSRVILAFSRRSPEQILELVRAAGLKDVHLSIIPRYFELVASSNAGMTDVEGIPVVEVPPARLSRLARFTKRSMDLSLAVPALVVLTPLFLVLAAAIKLDSRGPVFFRQPRMGRNQQIFRIYKVRTMVDGAEGLRGHLLHANESSGPLFKIRSDPRVTRLGRWLRRLSLDELPQLLNVVKGEMSLVGPRPFVVYEDAKIDGWARQRLDLTPGITGLWQVSGRNDIPFDEMVRLDYLYVNNWSLWWDIKLLLRTIPIVFSGRGY